SGDATVQDRLLRRGNADAGSGAARPPAFDVSRLPASRLAKRGTEAATADQPSGNGGRHRAVEERGAGRDSDSAATAAGASRARGCDVGSRIHRAAAVASVIVLGARAGCGVLGTECYVHG